MEKDGDQSKGFFHLFTSIVRPKKWSVTETRLAVPPSSKRLSSREANNGHLSHADVARRMTAGSGAVVKSGWLHWCRRRLTISSNFFVLRDDARLYCYAGKSTSTASNTKQFALSRFVV
jgi:hypothetical protein